MSMLAVVSKGVFDKGARVDGRRLAEGDVWPTARYASTSAALAPLADGGDLYLVTVRPGDVAWLVAVLVGPRRDATGWTAAPNVVPIRDVTALLPSLRFSTGKGVTAAPGKLGMSLQTPRVLTAEDVALLTPAGPAEAYARALAATPTMKEGAA